MFSCLSRAGCSKPSSNAQNQVPMEPFHGREARKKVLIEWYSRPTTHLTFFHFQLKSPSSAEQDLGMISLQYVNSDTFLKGYKNKTQTTFVIFIGNLSCSRTSAELHGDTFMTQQSDKVSTWFVHVDNRREYIAITRRQSAITVITHQTFITLIVKFQSIQHI